MLASGVRLVERSVKHRPQMNRPAEQKEPEHPGQAELKDCSKQPPLQELAQPRHEEAAERRYHIARGTLARHSRTSREMVVVQPDRNSPYGNYETGVPEVS